MYRAAIRSSPRALRPLQQSTVASSSRRFLATKAPADKKYTWKGTAARWTVAIGALYWYNTSPIFAEFRGDELPPRTSPAPLHFSEADLPTVDAVVEEKRKQIDAKLKEQEAKRAANRTPPPPGSDDKTAAGAAASTADAKSPEELEEEAGQQGAFNPETGEINWDCPCLGGMAHGPCGEEFKSAFSCFVHSNEEPKGMDCIDKFQHMQDCFRKYPEIYGADLEGDEDEEAPPPGDAAATAPAISTEEIKAEQPKAEQFTSEETKAAPTDAPKKSVTPAPAPASETPKPASNATAPEEQVDEARGVPKKVFDATAANQK